MTPTFSAVLIVVAVIATAISATEPVSVVTARAPTTFVVFASIRFISAAEASPAATVTATFVAVLIVAELIAAAMSVAKPVSLVTAVATTLTVVLASRATRSPALTVVGLVTEIV